MAVLTLSVLQVADGRLVTFLLVSGACGSRTRPRPVLYWSASSESVQSASSESRRCWMSACISDELIFLRFLELTTQQWVSVLFNAVKPTTASWSEKEVLSTLHWELIHCFPHYHPVENVTTALGGVTDHLCQTVVTEQGL